MNASDLVQLLRAAILVRAGDVVDARLADERARNIAVALMHHIAGNPADEPAADSEPPLRAAAGSGGAR